MQQYLCCYIVLGSVWVRDYVIEIYVNSFRKGVWVCYLDRRNMLHLFMFILNQSYKYNVFALSSYANIH